MIFPSRIQLMMLVCHRLLLIPPLIILHKRSFCQTVVSGSYWESDHTEFIWNSDFICVQLKFCLCCRQVKKEFEEIKFRQSAIIEKVTPQYLNDKFTCIASNSVGSKNVTIKLKRKIKGTTVFIVTLLSLWIFKLHYFITFLHYSLCVCLYILL